MRSPEIIQNEMDSKDEAIKLEESKGNEANVTQLEILRADLANLRNEKQASYAEIENQQHLQERVEQAKETGYLLDTIEINGLPAIAFSHTPENHELLAIAVQKLFIAQEDAFNSKLNATDHELTQERILTNDLNDHIEQMEREKNKVDAENNDLQSKLRNAANIIIEKDAEIKRLQDQTTPAVQVAPLSAEEQETKLVADLMGNRLKVTDIRFKDESGLDRRKVLANNALTGDEIEEYAIYSKTRWEEISFEEAAQLQADYAIKKAEIEAQNADIPALKAPELEPVLEVETLEPTPFPIEEELRAAAATMVEGSPSSDREVETEESKVVQATNDQRIHALERSNLEMQTWIDSIEKRVGKLDGVQPYINEDAEEAA